MRVVSLLNSGANTKAWLGKVCQTQIMQNSILLCFQQSLNNASQCGHMQVVRLLISRGANLDSRDKVCGFNLIKFVAGQTRSFDWPISSWYCNTGWMDTTNVCRSPRQM